MGMVHFCCCFVFIFETKSCYVAQAGPDLVILLQFPKYSDYRHVPPHLALDVVLSIPPVLTCGVLWGESFNSSVPQLPHLSVK
jgi:hypothetical protein